MTTQGTATAAATSLPEQPAVHRTEPHHRPDVSKVLLAAIVVCAAFGALGCAAGLAAGSTHAAHFPTTAVPDRTIHLPGAHDPISTYTGASTPAGNTASPNVAEEHPDGGGPIAHNHEGFASLDRHPRTSDPDAAPGQRAVGWRTVAPPPAVVQRHIGDVHGLRARLRRPTF